MRLHEPLDAGKSVAFWILCQIVLVWRAVNGVSERREA
jgi:hypothetical protein